MTKQENTRKIYIRSTKTWVSVTEEVYREYYRPIWRLQKETQKNGQCMCPKAKLWVCDGDCATCEYRAAGNTISLDAPSRLGPQSATTRRRAQGARRTTSRTPQRRRP